MARDLPVCEEEMLKIQHVTKANYIKYGAKLLEITVGYAAERMGKQSLPLFVYNFKLRRG